MNEVLLRRRRAVLGYLLMVMACAFVLAIPSVRYMGSPIAILQFLIVWLAALNAFWAGKRSAD